MSYPTLDCHRLSAESYKKLGPCLTSIPAPLDSSLLLELEANLRAKSLISTVVELIVVIEPSTCRLPLITIFPASSLKGSGSI